jgi:hypothetical protein
LTYLVSHSGLMFFFMSSSYPSNVFEIINRSPSLIPFNPVGDIFISEFSSQPPGERSISFPVPNLQGNLRTSVSKSRYAPNLSSLFANLDFLSKRSTICLF